MAEVSKIKLPGATTPHTVKDTYGRQHIAYGVTHSSSTSTAYKVYIAEFDGNLNKITDYQDGLAEGFMGILGKVQPNVLSGTPCDANDALDFIRLVKSDTLSFYEKLPKGTIYKGITSDCETFIQNINKYDYLFHLCDNGDY